MNDIQISRNFKLKEFQCKDGSELVKLDEILLEKLQQLRDRTGKAVQVVSGYRTPEYNRKIGGAPRSQHMEGKAADIKIKGMTPAEVALLAEQIGFKGIGVYPTFTHVDVRANKSYWIERKGMMVSVVKLIKSMKELE